MGFLVKRFDRTSENKRIHFISAMTALGKIDGNNAQDGTSYLDIVQCIHQQGSKPKEDLLELWKRIVFSIAVTNTEYLEKFFRNLLLGESNELRNRYCHIKYNEKVAIIF